MVYLLFHFSSYNVVFLQTLILAAQQHVLCYELRHILHKDFLRQWFIMQTKLVHHLFTLTYEPLRVHDAFYFAQTNKDLEHFNFIEDILRYILMR